MARPMLRFALTRLTLIVPTFVGVTLLAFLLIRLAAAIVAHIECIEQIVNGIPETRMAP